jgi:hypothetical protein
MAGYVPAIHAGILPADGREMPGHDEFQSVGVKAA